MNKNLNKNIKLSHILYFLPLPDDIITNILLFDNYIIRDGKMQLINKIKFTDYRYEILNTRPLLFISINNSINNNNSVNNSITIYNNITDKSIIDQYNYIYKSIQILKHF
jgi:hypothetical protein